MGSLRRGLPPPGRHPRRVGGVGGARKAAAEFTRESPECRDESHERIRPLVEAIHDFYPKREVDPGPFALTGLA